MVMMDPAALQRGSAEYAGHAETIGGDAASIAELASLRDALGRIGDSVWPELEKDIDSLRAGVEHALELVRNISDGLLATGGGVVTLDKNIGDSMR